MELTLVDISHHNRIKNWKELNNSVDGVILKVTQGYHYLDPTFIIRRDKVKGYRGFYHFSNYSHFQKEADWFIWNLPKLKKGDFLCLDAENGESRSWCKKWCDYVEAKTGLRPIIYTNASGLKGWEYKAKNPLWIARYGSNNGKMNLNFKPKISPYKEYLIWQYTSNGRIRGIEGRVDINTATDKLKEFTYQITESEKNEPVTIDKCRDLQSSLTKMKASLNGYIVKNKELTEKIKIQNETIERIKSINSENAKNTKIIDALMYFLKSIISKLK